MLGSRWHKVLNDLWGHKLRTSLIVLSIAVGLFAVGTVASSRAILSTEMARSYATINPSSGTVRTVELFGEELVRSVRRMTEVAEADARRVLEVRIEVASGEWANLTVYAVEEYGGMRVNRIRPERGAWPPPERQILIERAALPLIGAQIGDHVNIEFSGGKQRALIIAGTVHDMALMPAQFDNTPYGYVSFETLQGFGEPYGYNELHIVARNARDEAHAQQVVNLVKSKVERIGYTIPLVLAAEPGQIPLDDILQALLFIMGVLGLLSLFLSLFLIINTVTAFLVQQKRQIGIMKAIGASTSQLLGMYVGMVSVYGLLALMTAVPLGAVGSSALSRFMAAMFNFDLANSHIPATSILLQVAVGLLVPLLASLYPFVANLRITAAQAMSTYRVARGRFGTHAIDRMLSGANLWFARRILRRPLVLSLRSVFRNKGRLALTLITLAVAGATFIGVASVRASLDSTLDGFLRMWDMDILLSLQRPYRVAALRREAESVQGILEADVWVQVPARRVRPDGSEGKAMYLFAPRAGSRLFPGPQVMEGRWLVPEDENALVVDAILLKEEPDIRVGSDIRLKIGGREVTFRVVGVSLGIMSPMVYANYPYIARITGNVGRADTLLVRTVQHDQASVTQVAAALEEHLEDQAIHTLSWNTTAAERAEAEALFGIVVALLLIMALLLAVVGGLGLMGTLTINVLERTREIGVLRSIGARSWSVALVFIRESMTIGALSWLIGCILGYPLAQLISNAVGTSLLGRPLLFSYSMGGVLLWLLLVTILAALASLIPARSASRLTVREVLAYE